MPPDPRLVDRFKRLLDRMGKAGPRYYERGLERDAQRLRRWLTPDWLKALDRAIGRGKKRRLSSAYLLAKLADLPEVADRFNAWLRDPDTGWRSTVMAIVGGEGLRQFAPAINEALALTADHPCWTYAIDAAGELRSEENLPALRRWADDPKAGRYFVVLWAIKNFAHPDFRPALERFFRKGREKREQVVAAWGLAKLGDEEALRYLGEMLDDPEIQTETMYDPGESLRAAQALCDVFGWPFGWDRRWVGRTRKRWQQFQQERGVTAQETTRRRR